jgi:hypothetical protein
LRYLPRKNRKEEDDETGEAALIAPINNVLGTSKDRNSPQEQLEMMRLRAQNRESAAEQATPHRDAIPRPIFSACSFDNRRAVGAAGKITRV